MIATLLRTLERSDLVALDCYTLCDTICSPSLLTEADTLPDGQ